MEGKERRGGSSVHRKGESIVPFAERGEVERRWKIPATARIVVLQEHCHSKSPPLSNRYNPFKTNRTMKSLLALLWLFSL